MIRLQDALRLMEDKQPFNIEFVTYNRDKDTGGEIRKLDNVLLTGSKGEHKDNQMRTVRTQHSLQHPHAFHIRLLTKYNGERVIW